MQVRAGDLFVVWVSVRSAAEVEPSQNRYPSCAILIGPLGQLDPTPRDIEKKRLALVRAEERDANSTAQARVLVSRVISPVLLHGQ